MMIYKFLGLLMILMMDKLEQMEHTMMEMNLKKMTLKILWMIKKILTMVLKKVKKSLTWEEKKEKKNHLLVQKETSLNKK